MSGNDPIVPEGVEAAFDAAKDAQLLTVHGIDGAGCGWLTIRLLADWLRFCTINPESGKSDIGVVIFSFKHNFDYYSNHLASFGINLTWHLEQGHLQFLGNQFLSLVADQATDPPTPPSLTFDASMDMVMDMASEMREKYDRTVLLLDNPEMGLMLTSDDDDVRVEKWLMAIDAATYLYHNAIVSMVVEFAHPVHFPVTEKTADATATAVCSLNLNSKMAITVRPGDSQAGSGRISIVYRMGYEVNVGEDRSQQQSDDASNENLNVSVGNNGLNIEIMGQPFR
ncbi:60S ribosomal protein L37 [Sporothrix stenoceras]|uniref:60S ribosomal protein L37 n=1 Tax=Sporothrix stenoceras TaxID=5173 RepID=A0ABR3YU48_9PEZI